MANEGTDTKKTNETSALDLEVSATRSIARGSIVDDKNLGGHLDYHGINTSDVQPGADAAYEKKIAVMNEALIDIGMRSFQWKVYAMTGFGWFVDNVSILPSSSFRAD